MRKKLVILLILVLVVAGYSYRYEWLFRFQYARLSGLSCQSDTADFINDSCLQKIWVHRVNSVKRYQLLRGRFAGAEADLVWDARARNFRVYHPPAQRNAVLLDSFLGQVNTARELLWLDTRETPVYDTMAIGRELDRLHGIHGLKLNAVIEVYDTAVANYLANRGYWIALNIQPAWLASYSEADWRQFRLGMSPAISFISQEDIYLPELKKRLPGKDIITWSLAFENYLDRGHLESLLRDPQVKIVLVNIKSRYYQ